MKQCRYREPDADSGVEPVSGLLPSTLVSIVKDWNRQCAQEGPLASDLSMLYQCSSALRRRATTTIAVHHYMG